jgi:hypothetical protein
MNRDCVSGVCTTILVALGALEAAQGSVMLSYVVPTEISLGEPVLIQATFANSSNRRVEADLGWNGVGNFRFVVSQPGAAPASVTPTRPGGLVAGGRYTVAAGDVRRQTIVLSRWFDFPTEGLYDVAIRFEGTIRTLDGQSIEVNREHRYPIRVLPRDERRLRNTLELLLQAAVQPSSSDWPAAGVALASTKDPVVVPFLLSLANDPRLATTAVYGLAHVDGAEARAALEELSRSATPEIASLSKAALAGRLR